MYEIEFYQNVRNIIDREIENLLLLLNNCRMFSTIDYFFVCFLDKLSELLDFIIIPIFQIVCEYSWGKVRNVEISTDVALLSENES